MRKIVTVFVAVAAAAQVAAAASHWSLTMEKIASMPVGLEPAGRIQTVPSSGQGGLLRWSVGCETLDRDYAVFSEYKDYIGPLGVGYARLQSGWAKTERVKGEYDFAWLDSCVDGLLEQGVKPWICLCYGNPLYSSEKSLGSKIFTDEETMSAWLRYVGAAARRYLGKVNLWEIWNEPNLGKNNTKEARAYAELLIRTGETLRAVDPEAEIIGFGASKMPLKFIGEGLRILQERGRLDLLDYVSFHPYYPNPDKADKDIDALRALVDSYDKRIGLFQGECGCLSVLEWGHALRYIEWTEYSQVKWDLRRMACDFTRGIPSSIFTMIDLVYPNMQQSFGLIRGNLLKKAVYRRPSYYGVQGMVNILNASLYSGGRIPCSSSSDKEISAAGIVNSDGETVGVMLWFGAEVPSSELSMEKTTIRLPGVKLVDPVFVEPITGVVYSIPKHTSSSKGQTFKGIPLWDSPVFIIERDAVRFGPYVPFTERGTKAAGSVSDMKY